MNLSNSYNDDEECSLRKISMWMGEGTFDFWEN